MVGVTAEVTVMVSGKASHHRSLKILTNLLVASVLDVAKIITRISVQLRVGSVTNVRSLGILSPCVDLTAE